MSKKIIYSALFIVFVQFQTFSQVESHYWTNQYGAKGLLLNGAVIASADDETSIYYNPGCMGLDNNLGFAFSFLTPTYSALRTQNFIGDDNLIEDNGLGFSPGFLAVRFRPSSNEKLVLGVTSFKRHNSNIKFEDRVTNIVENASGFLFRADLKFQQKLSQDWIGIGMAYNITPKLGIGITQFSIWHNESIDLKFVKEIVLDASPQTVFKSWRSEFDYDLNISSAFITKLGLNYLDDNFSLGLTFTSPMYGMIRTGANYAIDDQRVDQAEVDVSTISNRKEIGLLEYKTPYSVGFGLDVKVKEKLKLSFSTEYFNSTDPITYFEETEDSFDGIATGNADVNVSVKTQRQSVTNFALGFQYLKNEKVTIIGGFRTDLNESATLKINDDAEYLGATPSVFHVSGGGTFKYGKNIFSIGIDLGYGQRSGGQQLADLSDITSENLFTFSGNKNVNSKFYSGMLFITYDFIYKSFTQREKPKEEASAFD